MLEAGLRRAARAYGGQVAFWQDGEGLTWAELLDRGARLAQGLRARGLPSGARVAVLLPNGFALVQVLAACILSDLVFTPLNVRLTADELAAALSDCDASVLIVDTAFGEKGRAAAAKAGATLLDAGPGAAEDEALSRLFQAGVLADQGRAPDDRLLAIFYTGGTTGRPKGVMLSRGSLAYNALASIAEGAFGPGEVVFHASPAFHIAGALTLVASILSGATGVLTPGFDAATLLRLIPQHRITQGLLVPTMLGLLLDHPLSADADLSSLTTVLYGASPMPTALLERAMARIPQSRFMQFYGMTETSAAVCVLHTPARLDPEQAVQRPGSVGRAFMGLEVCVMDESGAESPRGAFGEICVRGPGVMLGYWNNPAATAAAIRDGWMRTGDGGHMDADGYVYLADRLKDMIISGGENVFSVEVENVLARHPDVRQCAVVGVPHEVWGEAVHAVVVPHLGATLDPDALLSFCQGRLGGFKRPRSVTVRDEPLPLSAAGKVLKAQLRAELHAR